MKIKSNYVIFCNGNYARSSILERHSFYCKFVIKVWPKSLKHTATQHYKIKGSNLLSLRKPEAPFADPHLRNTVSRNTKAQWTFKVIPLHFPFISNYQFYDRPLKSHFTLDERKSYRYISAIECQWVFRFTTAVGLHTNMSNNTNMFQADYSRKLDAYILDNYIFNTGQRE
jgi:hypothetical protein